MNHKRVIPFALLLLIGLMLNAATVSEVYNARDVVAVLYEKKLTLIDLDTGNEAFMSTSSNIVDLMWDAQGKNLYALQWLYGNNKDRDNMDKLRFIEISMPSVSATVLCSFTPDNLLYHMVTPIYSFLALNKQGTPIICVQSIDREKRDRWEVYTYDAEKKKMPRTSVEKFDRVSESYQRKNQPRVSTESGKYSSRLTGGTYHFYIYKDNKTTELSVPEADQDFYRKKREPYRYCESPDGTFVVYGYRIEDKIPQAVNYIASTDRFEKRFLAAEGYLGDSFTPGWTSKGQMVFLNPKSSTLLHWPPQLRVVGPGIQFTTVKQWNQFDEYPLRIFYRAK